VWTIDPTANMERFFHERYRAEIFFFFHFFQKFWNIDSRKNNKRPERYTSPYESRWAIHENELENKDQWGYFSRKTGKTGVSYRYWWWKVDTLWQLKAKKSWSKLGYAPTSTAKSNIHGSKPMLCIWWDQQGVMYYELLQFNETIIGDRYRLQLMGWALKEKRPQHEQRYKKVIVQHDNARPHIVKTCLETLKWEVLSHPVYSPDIAPSDTTCSDRWHTAYSSRNSLGMKILKSESSIVSKDADFFQRGIHRLPERWKKVVTSDEQNFE